MRTKDKKFCTNLDCIGHLLILTFVVTGYVSAFTPLVGIPIGIAISTVGLKIFVITAGIKKYK